MDLTGLDGVPWPNLGTAYGTAEEIPGLLLGLVSVNPERRRASLSELFDSVCHQETIYEASAFTVPFLVQVAVNPAVPDREHLLDLLRCLAEGGARVPEWAERTRSAVIEGSAGLLPLLDEADPVVRQAAVHLLGSAAASRADVRDALSAVATTSPHGVERANAILALGALGPRVDVSSAGSPATRLAAALSSLPNASNDTEREQCVSLLLESVEEGYRVLASSLPWVEFDDWPAFLRSILDGSPALLVTVARGLAALYDPALRREGVAFAGEMARTWRHVSREAVDILGDRLSDIDGATRAAAAAELRGAYPVSEAAREAMVTALPASRDAMQRNLVVTLARLRDRSVIAGVVATVRSGHPPLWIGEALLGLGEDVACLVDDVIQLLPRFSNVITNGELDNRLRHSIRWLSDRGEAATAVVPFLGQLLAAPQSALGAAMGLARLGHVAAPVERELAAASRCGNAEVQIHAARALWHIGGDAQPLLEILTGQLATPSASLAVSWKHVEELGEELRPLVPSMWPLLAAPDKWIRVGVSRMMCRAGVADPACVAVLMDATGPDRVGMRALSCLTAMPESLRKLRPQLEAWNTSNRRLAVGAFRNDAVERDEAFRSLTRQALDLLSA